MPTTVLIADASKSSLVMSSEVFKDKIPGAIVLVAGNGKDCLELLTKNTPDMCVVDFDLPDTDGTTLIHAMRKTYKGPILLTAYPDDVVAQAVGEELFAFNDAGAWIKKPIKFDELSAKIDQFLLDQHRLGRRFDVAYSTQIIGKGAGRGKRAPKVTGRIVNLSLGGVRVELDSPAKMKNGHEITLSVPLDASTPHVEVPKVRASAKAAPKAPKPAPGTALKAKICWLGDDGLSAGIQFDKLSDSHKRSLENLLKTLSRV